MPSLPIEHSGGLPPGAIKAPSTGSHLADTGTAIPFPDAKRPTPPDVGATVDAMPARTYVLNTNTGLLHDRGMLSERCNTDQIPRSARAVSRDESKLLADPRYKRKCGWCHPKVVENPNAEADS